MPRKHEHSVCILEMVALKIRSDELPKRYSTVRGLRHEDDSSLARLHFSHQPYYTHYWPVTMGVVPFCTSVCMQLRQMLHVLGTGHVSAQCLFDKCIQD